MNRRQLLLSSAAVLLLPTARAQNDAGVVVIAHNGVPRIDVATVQRLYTGRAIEAGNLPVSVVHLAIGNSVRQRFLAGFLQTDEERYRAYWTVRRHVGRGAPPRELDGLAEMLEFVTRTPGAVGYVDSSSLRPGVNVICRG